MASKNDDGSAKLAREVKKVGIRAVKVLERAAGGGPWTEDAILRAADWLERGAKDGGLQRPWPTLAARLRNLVAAANGPKETNEAARAAPRDMNADAPIDAPARATRAKAKKAPAAEPGVEAVAPTSAPGAKPIALVLVPKDPAALPFSEFAERYLKHLEKSGKSRGTVFSYSLDLNVAARHFGETRDVESIAVEDVADYFNSDSVTKNRGGKAKSAITVNKLRRTLRLALVWAAESGLIATAPIPVTAKVREAAEEAKAALEDEAKPAAPRKRGRAGKSESDAPADNAVANSIAPSGV